MAALEIIALDTTAPQLRAPASGDTYVASRPVAFTGVAAAVASKTAAYTATANDFTILCDATSAAFTVTLPAATGSGRIYNIKKIDASANDVTIDGNAAETIDGAATKALSAQWSSAQIQDTATGTWSVL